MADKLKARLPAWTYAGGEKAICSGVCLAIPCLDKYAPNVTGCCCMPISYDQELCDFNYFFENVVPNLHTGDIFLTSWPSKPGEWAETGRCMMRSRWTHVGMVYRPSDSPILHTRDRIFGFQTHDSRPLIAHMLVYGEMGFRDGTGFEMVDLETWTKDYLDKYSHSFEPDNIGEMIVGVRFLTGIERNDDFYRTIQQKVDDYWFRPYETQDTMMAAVDLFECLPCCKFMKNKQDDSSIFCSELVAEFYKAAGMLDSSLSGGEFIPRHFATNSRLRLLKGELSREFVLVGPMSEEERNSCKYKNRGQGDILSKDKFGPSGFWGVNTQAAMEIGWEVPPAAQTSTAADPDAITLAPSEEGSDAVPHVEQPPSQVLMPNGTSGLDAPLLKNT